MEYNLFMQAIDKDGNMHTWEYYTIKNYLINENHVYNESKWKFYAGSVNGVELQYSEKLEPYLMRNVSDFKTYCRYKVDRKHIKSEVPKEVLDKFLINESESKRQKNYDAIRKNANNLNSQYNNGGGGLCEYRPGYIDGYSFFGTKGVEISWINNDADVCQGIVTRTTIFNEIKELISQGIYLPSKKETKPKIMFYEDKKQLTGQLSILDLMTV